MATYRVHYWELSNYNSGKLIGRWFDLDGLTEEEHKEELQEWLEELTEETGELCEEWILGDVDGVPSHMHSEFGIDSEFFDMLETIENSHLDAEVFEAALDLDIPLDKVEELYQGNYRDDTDFAECLCEELGVLNNVPEHLQFYFDYERYGKDLMINDYQSSDGHYFLYY